MPQCPPGHQLEGAVDHTHRTVHSSVSSALNILSPNPNTFNLTLVRMRSDVIKKKKENPNRVSTGKITTLRILIMTFKFQSAIHIILFYYILFMSSVL